jgi:quercetin dioxygenase-like cupin family protein
MTNTFASKSAPKAYAAKPELANSLFYMGSLMSVLVSTAKTNGAFSLLEYRSHPHNEPPPHVHVGQDEILYILEGEIEAYTRDLIAKVGEGGSIFLPRDQAHAWYVTSPALRMLIMTTPGGLDEYFTAMASPATSMTLPDGAITYILDDPARAMAIGQLHGIRILTPSETRELLPDYPGFGASVEERERFRSSD